MSEEIITQNKHKKRIVSLFRNINKKEIEEIIKDLKKPAIDKVPKVVRKTGKYYSIKLVNKRSFNNTQSLVDENFYSDVSTHHPTRQGRRVKETPYIVIQKDQNSRNNHRTTHMETNASDDMVSTF